MWGWGVGRHSTPVEREDNFHKFVSLLRRSQRLDLRMSGWSVGAFLGLAGDVLLIR